MAQKVIQRQIRSPGGRKKEKRKRLAAGAPPTKLARIEARREKQAAEQVGLKRGCANGKAVEKKKD